MTKFREELLKLTVKELEIEFQGLSELAISAIAKTAINVLKEKGYGLEYS